jgi:hypothetical protein
MADLFRELLDMSRDDLEQEYDRRAPSMEVGLSFIREELARRDMQEGASCAASFGVHLALVKTIDGTIETIEKVPRSESQPVAQLHHEHIGGGCRE